MDKAPAVLSLVLLAITYGADRTHLTSRLTKLDAERDALHGRVDFLERAFTSFLAQQQQQASDVLPAARRLSEGATATATDSRATVQVEAPDGVAEIILGGEAAADNVVLSKAHHGDGAAFSLRRNETDVLSISAAGTLTAHTGVSSAGGAPLELRSSTVHQSFQIPEQRRDPRSDP